MKKTIALLGVLFTALTLTAAPVKIAPAEVEEADGVLYVTWHKVKPGKLYRLETSFDGLRWQDCSGIFVMNFTTYHAQLDIVPGQPHFVRLVQIR